MDRLTSRVLNDLGGVAFIHCHQEDCDGDCLSCSVQVEAEHKFKRYEDEEEQGLLFRLHCKVGDTIYFILWSKKHECYFVEEDLIDSVFVCRTGLYYQGTSLYMIFSPNDIGETVFLTKEEAERKLAEMREE